MSDSSQSKLAGYEADGQDETSGEYGPAGVLLPSSDETRGTILDTIHDIYLDTGMVKYVTVKVFVDDTRQAHKYVIRGCRRPGVAASDINNVNQLTKGHDRILWETLKSEFESVGVPYEIIGWGKLLHNDVRKYVTFYEEERHPLDHFDGHSEHCFIAREIIESGKSVICYKTYRVLSSGQLSPGSQRSSTTSQ